MFVGFVTDDMSYLCSCIGAQKKVYEYYFMKLKYYFYMVILQYKNPATPLKTRGINTTHQHF